MYLEEGRSSASSAVFSTGEPSAGILMGEEGDEGLMVYVFLLSLPAFEA